MIAKERAGWSARKAKRRRNTTFISGSWIFISFYRSYIRYPSHVYLPTPQRKASRVSSFSSQSQPASFFLSTFFLFFFFFFFFDSAPSRRYSANLHRISSPSRPPLGSSAAISFSFIFILHARALYSLIRNFQSPLSLWSARRSLLILYTILTSWTLRLHSVSSRSSSTLVTQLEWKKGSEADTYTGHRARGFQLIIFAEMIISLLSFLLRTVSAFLLDEDLSACRVW